MKWSFWNADQEDWMRWRLASLGYPYPNNLTSTSQLSTLQDRIFYAMFSMKSKNKNSCRLEFNLLSLQLVPTTAKETITKYILLSLVGKFKQSFLASIFYWSFTRTTGPEVKPLQKARSGGQRNEIQEFIKKVLLIYLSCLTMSSNAPVQVMPVNAHYQPGGPNELIETALLTKFAWGETFKKLIVSWVTIYFYLFY